MPLTRCYLRTGQTGCHDELGGIVACDGSGQDAVSRRGIQWPDPRFVTEDNSVHDRLTGLDWLRDANLAGYPMTWSEALEYVARMNHARRFGHTDWRVPNRRELRSLLCYQQTRPPLPVGHSFFNLFPNWYWSSTTAAPATSHAWYVHLDGGRMFHGGKDQSLRSEAIPLRVT